MDLISENQFGSLEFGLFEDNENFNNRLKHDIPLWSLITK